MYVHTAQYIHPVKISCLAHRIAHAVLFCLLLLHCAGLCSQWRTRYLVLYVEMYSSAANIRVFLQIQWTSTSMRAVRYILLTSCCFGSVTCSLKRLRWAEWTPLRTLREKQNTKTKTGKQQWEKIGINAEVNFEKKGWLIGCLSHDTLPSPRMTPNYPRNPSDKHFVVGKVHPEYCGS